MRSCKDCVSTFRSRHRRTHKRDLPGGRWPAWCYHPGQGRYCVRHTGLRNKDSAARRAQKIHAQVAWADLEKIKNIYTMASHLRNGGQNVHVDHIVPLRGKTVCGLHVEQNLQIIPRIANVSKGNRSWPDMPR